MLRVKRMFADCCSRMPPANSSEIERHWGILHLADQLATSSLRWRPRIRMGASKRRLASASTLG
jgi:hypothetical protein